VSAYSGNGTYGYSHANVTLENSIVANDTGGAVPNDTDTTEDGAIRADFSLLESDQAPVTPVTASSNIVGQDPQLGPLQDNGGPTPTMALPKTSPAVDKGRTIFGVTTDQRGLPREADWEDVPNSTVRFWDGVDMGAFELQIPPKPPVVNPAECNSTEATKQGTAGNDVINGTPQRDVIQGLGGNDTIRGLGGGDLLCGGSGKDKVTGGAGNDILFGEAGGDSLSGGQGKDFLLGGAGADTLLGGAGKDTLLGGGAKDKLNGGPGKDLEKQ
jgi:Ca2+-binding RTX toxin-like protein